MPAARSWPAQTRPVVFVDPAPPATVEFGVDMHTGDLHRDHILALPARGTSRRGEGPHLGSSLLDRDLGLLIRPGSHRHAPGMAETERLATAAKAAPSGIIGEAEQPRIRLRNVTKSYTVGDIGVVAIDNLSLEIAEGAFVVILGPSGCGKTTLLNLIGALDVPTLGSVQVEGLELSTARRAERTALRRRTVSFIFQSFNLFPGLTALENVRFGADASRRPHADQRARDALSQVGLLERSRHFPHQLSGGEQQRVAIARALATGNPVMLADEPTGELDFRTGVQILEALEAQSRAGMTVLVVTHNREISRIADRVIELSSGRIVGDGPPTGGRAAITDLQW